MSDTILHTTPDNPNGSIWYSEEYLIKQIELSYLAGMTVGSKIEFHSITPTDKESSVSSAIEFVRIVGEKFNQMHDKELVFRKAFESKFK